MAFLLLHALLGVVAGRELDLAGEGEILEMLDAILHRRGVFAQHVEPGAVGHEIDVNVLALVAVIFDDVGDIVECQIHDRRVVLVDLDRDPMHLAVGGEPSLSERQRGECRNPQALDETTHRQTPVFKSDHQFTDEPA